jgi:hypothetical protein
MLPAPGDPWAGYARTVVEIARPLEGDLVVCAAPPGEVGEWPWAEPGPVLVLTAWDPGDERPGDAVNRERQRALDAELRPVAAGMWRAVGTDPTSGRLEEGVAVCGVAQEAGIALGARYRQDALFVWTPEAWTIVACWDERRLSSGWSIASPRAFAPAARPTRSR